MGKISSVRFLRLLQTKIRNLALDGFQRVDEKLENDSSQKYCCLADGTHYKVYFYSGPYLDDDTVWVGLGADSSTAFNELRRLMPKQIGVLRDGYLNDDHSLTVRARKKVYNSKLIVELPSDSNRSWFGEYFTSSEENVVRTVSLIIDLTSAVSALNSSLIQRPWEGATEGKAMRKLRLAQGFFRAGQLKQWNARCCVTGCPVLEVLRASHIDQWAKNEEGRTDQSNGLLLVSTLDSLFDRNRITFTEAGTIKISRRIVARDVPGLHGNLKINAGLSAAQSKYMRIHQRRFEDSEKLENYL